MENQKIQIINLNNNFFSIKNCIFDFGLSCYEFTVYSCLMRHANITDKTCYPSLNRIAKLTHISKRKLIYSIDVLVKKGLIKKESGDYTKSNLYYILEPIIQEGSAHSAPGVVHTVHTNNTHINNKEELNKNLIHYESETDSNECSLDKSKKVKKPLSANAQTLYDLFIKYYKDRDLMPLKHERGKWVLFKVKYPQACQAIIDKDGLEKALEIYNWAINTKFWAKFITPLKYTDLKKAFLDKDLS